MTGKTTLPSSDRPLAPGLSGTPERDRAALLQIVRDLPPIELFQPGVADQGRSWMRDRIRSLANVRLPQLNDGHRLPGREGPSTAAAVLVPIINRPTGLTLLLTQRSANLPEHPGQISFPGGRTETHDLTPAHTALRETQEEIGLEQERVDILGEVGRYETVTGYSVTPVVGWIDPPLHLVTDPLEVAEAFEVPLSFVFDPGNYEQRQRDVGGRVRHYFVCEYEDRYIWGATAAMLLLVYYALAVPLPSSSTT